MKKLIYLLIAITSVVGYGLSFAAPNTQVTVVNTSSNPVPVNSVKKARQLLTTTQITTTSGQFSYTFTPSPLDVSGCESIRFSLKIPENPCSLTGSCYNSCIISDQSLPGGFVLNGFDLSPSSTSCEYSYPSSQCAALIQNPGTSQLTISCVINEADVSLSAVLYCW